MFDKPHPLIPELDQVNKSREQALAHYKAKFMEHFVLAEELCALYRAFLDLMGKKEEKVKKPGIHEGFQLLTVVPACNALGLLAAFQGQIGDSFYHLRRGIETCGYIYHFWKNPKTFQVWYDAKNDLVTYEAFKEAFSLKRTLRAYHQLKPLWTPYDHCSRKAHTSIISIAPHLATEENPKGGIIGYDIFSLDENIGYHVIYFIEHQITILRIMEEIFGSTMNERGKWTSAFSEFVLKYDALKTKFPKPHSRSFADRQFEW